MYTNAPLAIPDSLVQALRQAQHIAILTGAGTSAESGVPTFREAQTGLWAQYDPQELATPQAFQRSPKLVWEWYEWRRGLVAQAQPNPGHYALAQLEQLVPTVTLITQNVDGLHQRAGSRNPIELHGNIMRTKCFAEDKIVTSWAETGDVPPRCPRCGSLLRPDVVWFGESLPYAALQEAQQAARTCDVFLTIGTSALVQPAASLPITAMEAGAITVEINPQSTPLTRYMTHVLAAASGAALPQLLQAVW
ncbi:MAG: NAD-dependent deacylase [Anaerolinea sp.]|nr:NAD-dependent deacylase [Anaerolinea sp.]